MSQSDVDQWALASTQALQKTQAEQVRNSVGNALDTNPDQEAQTRRFATAAQVPLETARALPDVVKKQAQMSTFDADMLSRHFPKTSQLLADQDNAKLVHDDIPATAQVEQAVKALPMQPSQDQAPSKSSMLSDAIHYLFSTPAPGDTLFGDAGKVVGGAARALAGTAKYGALASSTLARPIDAVLGTNMQEGALTAARSLQDYSESGPGKQASFKDQLLNTVGSTLGVIGEAVATGGEATATRAGAGVMEALAPHIAHGVQAMMVPSAVAAQDAYNAVFEKTQDVAAATKAGLAGYVTSSLGGVVPFATPGKLAYRMATGAAMGPILGDVSQQATNLAMPDSMQAPERDGTDRALDAVMGSMFGALAGPKGITAKINEAARQSYVDAAKNEATFRGIEALHQVGQISAVSKLREREPEAFKQFVQTLTEDGRLSEVYVDAKELTNALNQSGVTPEDLKATMPDLHAQLHEAGEAKTDVRIPVADYATHIAGTDIDTAILPHLKVDPEGNTYSQAQEAYKGQVASLKVAADKIISESTDAQAAQAVRDGVRDKVLAKLNEAPGLDPRGNAHRAEAKADYYITMADRAGMTPDKFMETYPLEFSGPGENTKKLTPALTLDTLPQQVLMSAREEGDAGRYHPNGAEAEMLAETFPGMSTKVTEDGMSYLVDANGRDIHTQLLAEADKRNAEKRIVPMSIYNNDHIVAWEKAREQGGQVLEQPALPKKQTATSAIEVRQGEPLAGDQRMDIHQVGAYFDKIAGGARDINNPKDFAKALKMMTTELKFQMESEKSGLNWYDEDIKNSFDITQRTIPELADAGKRQLFSIIAGLQSPGTNARDNWVIAARAFQHYLDTGTVPGRNPENGQLWQGGPVSLNKEKALNFLNNIVQDLGEEGATKWAMSLHTVKELNEARKTWGNMGPGVSGKATDKQMGLFAFGPKVGPFVMNINGIHEVTVDVWATRSFNRYFGQMLGPDGKITDSPTEPQRRVAKELFNAAATELGIKPYQAQAALWFFEQQLFNKLGTGSASHAFSDGARKFAGADGGVDTGAAGGVQADVGAAQKAEGATYRQPEQRPGQQPGDGSGRPDSGAGAPLAGAPAVPGYHGPDVRVVAVADQYAADNGIDLKRQDAYVKVDVDRATRIAQAYADMANDPNDPKVKAAYADMIKQTVAQHEALAAAGYKFYFIDLNTPEGQAYSSTPWNAMRDARENQTMGVFSTNDGFGTDADFDPSKNPLFAETGLQWPLGPDGQTKPVLANDLFRAVHDAFGHGIEGAGFRAEGEENAWQAHSRLYTGDALGAMTSETRGQNSWVNYGPKGDTNRTAKVDGTNFADQKTGLMPEWTWTEGKAGDQPAARQSNLNDELSSRVAADFEGAVAEYNTLEESQGGTVINTDLARELSPGYRGDRSRSAEVHEAASAFIDRLFTDKLAQPTPADKLPFVLFTAGGTGAGKSTGLGLVPETTSGAEIVFDGTMSKFSSADRRIQQTLDAGREVRYIYTYRDPVEALKNGALPRAMNSGRTAPLSVLQESHIGARQVAEQLAAKYADNPLVSIQFVDNSRGKGNAQVVGLADLPAIDDNGLKEKLNDTLNTELAAGRISETVHRATQAGSPDPQRGGAGPEVGGRTEQQRAGGTANTLDQPARGQIAFGDDITKQPSVISLFKDADLSTFHHEMGHYFLEVHADLASKINARIADGEDVSPGEQGIANDFDTALTALGLKAAEGKTTAETWASMSLAEKKPYHEKFARSYENYLLAGQAPSLGLTRAFQSFRAWMLNVYKSITGTGETVSPEMKGVFDRMLASDDAIKEAEQVRGYKPLFETAAESGMTPEEFAHYQQLGKDATADAVDQLQARSLRDMQWGSNAKSKMVKDLQREAAGKRKEIQDQVTKEVDASPAFAAKREMDRANDPLADYKDEMQAWRTQRDGVAKDEREAWVGENPEPAKPRSPVDDWKDARGATEAAAREAEKARVTEGFKGIKKGQELAKNKRAIDNAVERKVLDWEQENPKPQIVKAKVDEQILADKFGYANPEEMRRGIMEAGSRKDAIEGMTDQRMLQEHGDLTDPASIERAAEAAIHNEVRARFVASELKALAKATGPARQIALAAKEAADTAIARKRIGDLRPAMYSAAEGRAGRASEKALRAGDLPTAASEKRAQLLNNRLVKSATDAIAEIEKGLTYLKKFDKASLRDKLPGEFIERIDELKGALDLRKSPSPFNRKAENILTWADGLRKLGYEPQIADWLNEVATPKSYKDASVEEFRGLVDAVKSLEHIARAQKEVTVAGKRVALDEVVGKLVDRMDERGQKFTKSDLLEPPKAKVDGVWKAVTHWLAVHMRMVDNDLTPQEYKFNKYDMQELQGPFRESLLDPILAGNYRKVDLQKQQSDMGRAVGDALGKDWQHSLYDGIKNDKLVDPDLSTPGAPVMMKMTRGRMLGIARHVGNESNFAKMVAGYKWEGADVWKFLTDNMNAKDWQATQAHWDSFDPLWAESEAMIRRQGGVVPPKIEARPFEIQVPNSLKGQTGGSETIRLKGGYSPLDYDPLRSRLSVRMGEFDLSPGDKVGEQMNYRATTTHNSSMVSRSEGYSDRVNLDFHSTDARIRDTIHDLAYREALLDASKIVGDAKFRQKFMETYGREEYQALTDWLTGVRDTNVSDPRNRKFDSAMAYARQGVVLTGIGYRVSTVLKHGGAAALKSLGYLGTGDGAKYFASRVARMATGHMQEDLNQARDKFPEIRARLLQMDRDFKVGNRSMYESEGWKEKNDRFGHAMVAWSDALSATPTAWAAYDLATTKGIPTSMGGTGKPMSEANAVLYANSVVRQAHGSALEATRSNFMQARGAKGFFGALYGFMNNTYGQTRDMLDKSTSGGYFSNNPAVAARLLATLLVPAIWTQWLKDGGPDDLHDPWYKWAGKAVAGEVGAMVPFVRDAVSLLEYGRGGSIAPMQMVTDAVNSGKDLWDEANGKQTRLIQDLSNAVGEWGHIAGLGQLGHILQYARDVSNGRKNPQSEAQAVKEAVIGGAPKHP